MWKPSNHGKRESHPGERIVEGVDIRLPGLPPTLSIEAARLDESSEEGGAKVSRDAGTRRPQSSNAAPHFGHFEASSDTSEPQFVHVNAAALPAFPDELVASTSSASAGGSGLP